MIWLYLALVEAVVVWLLLVVVYYLVRELRQRERWNEGEAIWPELHNEPLSKEQADSMTENLRRHFGIPERVWNEGGDRLMPRCTYEGYGDEEDNT